MVDEHQMQALAFLRNALHRCDQENIDPLETINIVYKWYTTEHAKPKEKKWRRMQVNDILNLRPGNFIRIAKDASIPPGDFHKRNGIYKVKEVSNNGIVYLDKYWPFSYLELEILE